MTAGTSTVIRNQIVPLRLTFSDGTILDAGPIAGLLQSSPLYADASYAAGNTQFGDAVMRSEFWKYAAHENYHVLLAKPVIEPTVSVTIPAADGHVVTTNGNKEGYITFAYFMNTIEANAISKFGISPASLTIFATYNTQLLQQTGACCYAGYHNALTLSTPSGKGIFTTVWASVVSYQSVDTMSHEMAEWLNDPFYTNQVPAWIQPNTGACAGSLLEVGDPVTEYVFTAGGYAVQDIAFYSWFSRNVPSIGINGQYDLLGKLTKPAATC